MTMRLFKRGSLSMRVLVLSLLLACLFSSVTAANADVKSVQNQIDTIEVYKSKKKVELKVIIPSGYYIAMATYDGQGRMVKYQNGVLTQAVDSDNQSKYMYDLPEEGEKAVFFLLSTEYKPYSRSYSKLEWNGKNYKKDGGPELPPIIVGS